MQGGIEPSDSRKSLSLLALPLALLGALLAAKP